MYWRGPSTRRCRRGGLRAAPLGRSQADAIVPLCNWGTENMAEMTSIFAKRDAFP